MSVERGYSAERVKPFASDHWAGDTPVLADHRLEHDYPIPRFGDEDRWDLGALGWNPAAGRHSASMHRWGGVWSGVVTQKCLSDQEE